MVLGLESSPWLCQESQLQPAVLGIPELLLGAGASNVGMPGGFWGPQAGGRERACRRGRLSLRCCQPWGCCLEAVK